MGLSLINGLPAHILLIHVLVIFVPLTALLVILSSLWPTARRRLGIVTPIAALITLVAIPPTMSAGDWLATRVAPGPLLNAHTHIADTLLPFALGVFVLAFLVWALYAKPNWFLRGGPARGDERVLVGSSVGAASTPSAAAEGTTAMEPPAAGTPTPVVPTWMRVVRIVAVVLAVAVSVGSVVDVYQIGDSGARAAWNGEFSTTPKTGG
jgi:hypothetical protein